jgi:hypothetical protein
MPLKHPPEYNICHTSSVELTVNSNIGVNF